MSPREKVQQARLTLADCERALALSRRVLQGQRLIFADMVASNLTIPPHCRETHRAWIHHNTMLYLAREHAKANLAMAEVLAR